MYALVEILGKQYKAVEGETLQVDLLSLAEGSAYETDKVLAVVDGDKATFGTPYVAGAKVVATVGSEVKGDKVKVNKGAKTYSGGGLASFVYNNTYDVIEVRGDRIVIGLGSAVTAAMNAKDLKKV